MGMTCGNGQVSLSRHGNMRRAGCPDFENANRRSSEYLPHYCLPEFTLRVHDGLDADRLVRCGTRHRNAFIFAIGMRSVNMVQANPSMEYSSCPWDEPGRTRPTFQMAFPRHSRSL